MNRNHPYITDHALLRYFERVKGMDVRRARAALGDGAKDRHVLASLAASGINIESYRRKLLTPKVLAAIAVGAKSVVCGAHRFIIRDGMVVTTAPNNGAALKPLRPVMKKGQARALREEERCGRLDVRMAELLE